MTEWLLALVLAVLAPRETCLSTMYATPGDKWSGTHFACGGQPVTPTALGIAHRTLPCGTLVMVYVPRTGLAALVPVIDRGPYGALLPDGTWRVKKRVSEPGKWRGCADLTPAAAELVGHDGWDRVQLYYPRPRWPRPRHTRVI